MKLPIKKIQLQAKSNYEEAWLNSANYLKKEGRIFNLKPQGKSHPVLDFICMAREFMIKMGFEEVMLPMMVDEEIVYKEYGPEAALILDRLFYLAELPRPEIGVSQKKIEDIRKIIPNFNKIDELKSIFRRYKKGGIEADDLIETMVEELKIEESEATAIIDKVFPEFKDLKPIPTKKTLRSHTTALWFPVLAELYKKKPLPLQYFLIGPKWRREQKVDQTHLITSNTLSLVIMAEEITLEDAKYIGKQIAQKIGFKKVLVSTKKATSKYYAPQTEFEIFVQHPSTKEWIEIGDGGFYSPVSLANFGIEYPVVNIGFGVERIVMIKTGEEDIRKLVYPYYYSEITFSDEEIANLLHYKNTPKTEQGKSIVKAIVESALKYCDKKVENQPIEILAWQGELNGKKVAIKLWERDKNACLLGKAARNIIWVKDGNIICRSFNSKETTGVKTNLSVLEGIANFIAYKAEEITLVPNEKNWSYRVRFVKHPNEINIEIDDKIRQFIHSNQKKIDVKGPIFIGVDIEIIEK
ncbi:MAG: O-phosphoserine--tRNA ligase [Promethearchaeota archaeon]